MAKVKKPKKGAPKEAPEDASDAGITAEEEGGEGAPTKKKLAGKTLILFIVLPALLILGGGGVTAALLLGGKGGSHAAAKDSGHKKAKGEAAGGHGQKGGATAGLTEGAGVFFYPMPEMLVNITGGDGRPVFLKLKLTVEAPSQEVIDAMQPNLPRVTDEFQSFLRELRVDDLAGSAGAYRLRLELLRRVNLTIAPAQANAVLIEEMLVQ